MRRRRHARITVPARWSPEQAASVIGWLERIADAVWDAHGDAIHLWRDQRRHQPRRPRAPTPPPTAAGQDEDLF